MYLDIKVFFKTVVVVFFNNFRIKLTYIVIYYYLHQ